MSAEVIPFHPALVGDGIALDPDAILDAAKGKYHSLVIAVRPMAAA